MNPFGWFIWVLLALLFVPFVLWFILPPGWSFISTLLIWGGVAIFVFWILSNTKFT